MKVFNYLLLLIGVVSILGCEKNSDLKVETSVTVVSDKSEIIADGVDEITFTVSSEDKDVTGESIFYVDGEKITGNKFKTTSVKSFKAYAMYKNAKSNEIPFKSIKVNNSIKIKADILEIMSDNTDKITFTAITNKKDVTSEIDFYVDGTKIDGNTFSTSQIKEFTVYGKKEEIKSDNQIKFKSVAAIADADKYAHKIIAEDYTGTWCGWCPRFIDAIEKSEDNKNFIPIAIHQGDKMQYSKVEALMTMYAIEGFPTAILNRVKGKDWDGGNPNRYINRYTNVAIGLQTSISGGTATVNVKVNFREVLDNKLRLVVYVLENNIIADQSNYLSGRSGFEDNRFYNLPNKVKDFSHNHVLRVCATDLKGDLIPDENRNEMKEYVKQYTIDISKYKQENCDIVAVVVKDDENNALGSVNAQKVKLGESIFY